MSLPTSQILALASAGFTAEQIDKFAGILDSASPGAPKPADPAPAEPEPAPAPAEPDPADPIAAMCADFEKQFAEFMSTSKQQIAALNVRAAERNPEPQRSMDDRINDAFASIYR